jgi:hypothetical protein
MMLQNMIADAHQDAKEIWDDMGEEELAVCFAHISLLRSSHDTECDVVESWT